MHHPSIGGHVAAVALAALAFAPVAAAQTCLNPTDTFWKVDTLPQNPSGLAAVSLIGGLCEGEAVGMVFNLPVGTPPQKLNYVAVGFGHAAGASGAIAAVNVEIYDGVVWNGNVPVLGPKVFDLEQDLDANMQVTSHGINVFDMSAQNVVVGNATDAFVVAFRMGLNPNGTCGGGYSANFFTDNGGFGGCNTIAKHSLIDIENQGWRDAKFANVGGFPLCPIFYNGNWVIRACTEDAGPPPVCQTSLGFQGPGSVDISLCGQTLASGNTATFLLEDAAPNALTVWFVSTSFSPAFVPELFGVLVPLPPLLVLQVNGTDANGRIEVPGINGGGGPNTVYLQIVVVDPAQIKGYAVSNALQINVLP